MKPRPTWKLPDTENCPAEFIDAIANLLPSLNQSQSLAQMLWQRQIREPEMLSGFLITDHYQPSSPFEFGEEMERAVERINQARTEGEKVAIWGDFDADGVTSTSVLLDGLRQFFPEDSLEYYIPNRLTDSHGLHSAGIERLAEQGTDLIITCDTGSTNLTEIELALALGIDIIITDHHTLLDRRPPVTAIINPRYLPESHPLFHLSGVAVAYKLIEALYERFPEIPQAPLEELLDLVAIGLIADLVQLKGDCRYLAQQGIARLFQDFQNSPNQRRRPGIGRLLELCRKTGDRPTDISFGIGPRINAVSRIYGDASFCVNLLSNRDLNICDRLAEDAELANSRRKELQQVVLKDAIEEVKRLDLSTTHAIILAKPEWPVGVLGLVAAQLAQDYHKPAILFSIDIAERSPLAKGSARSVANLDLYQLVKSQAHLLHRFGGHPFAAGLSLLVENLPLFTEGINQQLSGIADLRDRSATIEIDLVCSVSQLGERLFKELKYLEPCGMGNTVPKILVRDCWFENARNQNIKDRKGGKIRYIKTQFTLKDKISEDGIFGLWWGHYQDELPNGYCDAIFELDFNQYCKYHVRIIDLIPVRDRTRLSAKQEPTEIWDWRPPKPQDNPRDRALVMAENPDNWDNLYDWLDRAKEQEKHLAIAYPPRTVKHPVQLWESLVGIAKYLTRTGKTISLQALQDRLSLSQNTITIGLTALSELGFVIDFQDSEFQINDLIRDRQLADFPARDRFLSVIEEELFRQQYFSQIPVEMMERVVRDMENSS